MDTKDQYEQSDTITTSLADCSMLLGEHSRDYVHNLEQPAILVGAVVFGLLLWLLSATTAYASTVVVILGFGADVVISLLVMAMIPGVAGYLWDKRYQAAIAQFAAVNNWQPQPEANIRPILPHDFKGRFVGISDGYLVKLEGYGVTIYTSRGATIASWQSKNPLPTAYMHGNIEVEGKGSFWKAPFLEQRLSLEGDFDKYFQLYINKGQEIEVLSVITPDIMQLLIDFDQGFDIELDGSTISLISHGSCYYKESMPALLEPLVALVRKFAARDRLS